MASAAARPRARASRPQISTVCTLEFGQQYVPPDRMAPDHSAPGFFFTPTVYPWTEKYYAGMASTKYLPMWDLQFQGGGYSDAARTRPRTGGTPSCPMNDEFWTSPFYSSIRDPFLDMAYGHLSPPDSSSSEPGSDGPDAPPAYHLGGTDGDRPQRAKQWSFNQFTPLTRMMGGGTWPAPGSQLWHGTSYTGLGANDLEQLSLSSEGLLYSVCLISGISMRSKH